MNPSDTTAELLATRLQEMMNLLHSRFAQDTLALMVESEITLPQMVTLHVLKMGGATSVSGIQTALQLSASATSHLVDRLYAKGFVDRIEDPADRRQKVISITAAGADLIERLTAARTDQLTRAIQDLDPTLRARLVDLIDESLTQLRRNGDTRKCPAS